MCECECLVPIPLANGEEKRHGETCTSKNVDNLWKTREVPNPIGPNLLKGDPCQRVDDDDDGLQYS